MLSIYSMISLLDDVRVV